MSTIIVFVYLGLQVKWNQFSSNNSHHTSCVHKGSHARKWPDLMTSKTDSVSTLGYHWTYHKTIILVIIITITFMIIIITIQNWHLKKKCSFNKTLKKLPALDPSWHRGSRSPLVQVRPCCLTSPNCCLSQCQFTVKWNLREKLSLNFIPSTARVYLIKKVTFANSVKPQCVHKGISLANVHTFVACVLVKVTFA